MNFLRKQHLCFAKQIHQSVCSGGYSQHRYRITSNGFPYYVVKPLLHCVVWLNPAYYFDMTAITAIIDEIQKYLSHRGWQSILFENQVHQKSMPEVQHLQMLVAVED